MQFVQFCSRPHQTQADTEHDGVRSALRAVRFDFATKCGERRNQCQNVSYRDSPGAISQEVPALPEILMNSPPGQLQKWPLLAIFRTPMTIFSQFMTTTGCKLGTRFGSFSPTNRSGYVSHNVCTFVLYSWKRERGNLRQSGAA